MLVEYSMSQQSALSTATLPLRVGTDPALPVTAEDPDHVIGRLQRELQLLLCEQTALLKRIRLVRHTLAGLAYIFGSDIIDAELERLLNEHGRRDNEQSHPGLTETCRRILMEECSPLTVRQLCDKIRQCNPILFARHKDLSASVAVVMKRLESYGEVLEGFNDGDKRTWVWPQKAKEGANPPSLRSE
jgi:hypothetical protein